MAFLNFIFAGVLVSLVPGIVRGQAVDEYQVKAAFLYNFTKFVDWPEQAFKTPSDPIVICIFGQNPFGHALEEAVNGKQVGGRGLVVRQVSDVRQAAAAQILFVAASERKRYRAILDAMKSSSALTVGEDSDFLNEGGVVGFKLDNGRVRLEINLDAAQQQKLHISSNLLSLAQVRKK